MKKLMYILALVITLVIVQGGGTASAAVTPGYEDAYSQHKIAEFTVQYLYPNGDGGMGTSIIYNDPRYTDDQVIDMTLADIWTSNQFWIYSITHVNGVPIEKTKWAKYGGKIPHQGDPYTPPTTKPVPNKTEIFVYVSRQSTPNTGEKVTFPDTQPVIKDSRTMVPMRAVFEHKNVQAEVTWDENSRTVTAIDRTGRTIIFKVDSTSYQVVRGGQTKTLTCDVAPYIEQGRTMLPLRALSEGLDFTVNWLDSAKVVDILEKTGNDRQLMSSAEWTEFLQGRRGQ